MVFSPANPPSLRFTTVHQAVVNDVQLPRGETYWNSMMILALRLAKTKGYDAASIVDILSVNSLVGRKEDDGYKYLHDLGLSVQGQDSNAAFRQFFEICSRIEASFTVFFSWQVNEKAAFPGQRGYFEL
jgi:alpha-ketoglutarate-dependent taurine dioxygenase